MVHTVHTAEENIKYIDISISIYHNDTDVRKQWNIYRQSRGNNLTLGFGTRRQLTVSELDPIWPHLMLSWRCFVLIGLSDAGGEGCDACDVWQSRWPWSGSRDTALHVTPGAAAAAVYIVHCWRAAHGDNIVGCFVQRLADFLEYRYI